MNSSFEALGLSEALVRAVTDLGYTQPTPIQSQAIPPVLAGSDLMAGAQTGTGKTAAFVLPILQRLSAAAPAPREHRAPRVLILAPTRELAAQVEESVRDYGKHVHARCAVIFGGVSIRPQFDALKRGVDIVVATPGRLLDHVGQKTIDLSKIEVLVLDEADRMLDMGFLPDMKRVFAQLPRQRQTLLFSATFSDEIRTLAATLMRNPVSVQATPRNSTVEAVDQKAISIERTRKSELLAHLIKDNQWFQVLVFTRTKHGANRLAEYLGKHGVTALAIHGNKSQNARTRALADFKRGDLQALVATDIAARGLDIEQLPHVVNFDLPNVPEDYVHRIGRTGRAGATGEAISLVSREEEALLRDIERLIKRPVPRMTVPTYQPSVGAAHDPDHRPARSAQPSRRPAAPKRPASQPQRDARGRPQSGGGGRVKSPAQPGQAAKSRPGQANDAHRTAAGDRSHSPTQPRSTPRPAAARGGFRGSDRRDAGESLVRTNIPGFLQPTSRRGR
ncbi:MAG TPA: DEAD/DEAH box helicase [Burkholderiaceae bacterium]|nr:DEAD/DEAH box helicase [Burkholderiaceae bacterium]HQR75413.1 DEAD/DEAH box helicase [Burkholderiaceae bacterium]